jgi:hypothetical protein
VASAKTDYPSGGGSGFLVQVTLPQNHEFCQLYVVTASHVVNAMPNPVLRFNLVAGGFESLSTNRNRWMFGAESDIAVLPIDVQEIGLKYWAVDVEDFVRKDGMGLGNGDEAFMIGRFVALEGTQQNTPTVRFGNISMLPLERDVFLVEHRSLPGYSGSPVFAWINPTLPRSPVGFPFPSGMRKDVYGPWLLGIDSCHIHSYEPVLNSKDVKDVAEPKRWVKSHTGMAEVVPAWNLAELLNSQALVERRRQADEEIARAKGNSYRSMD